MLRPELNWISSQHSEMPSDSWRLLKVCSFPVIIELYIYYIPASALANLLSFCPARRSDFAEGSGDKRVKAEDRRGNGGHAQHHLLCRDQQHDPCNPTLLLQVHGHQSFQLGPQCLHLPAAQEVNVHTHRPLCSLICLKVQYANQWNGVVFLFELPLLC